jgi:hypothetical protein
MHAVLTAPVPPGGIHKLLNVLHSSSILSMCVAVVLKAAQTTLRLFVRQLLKPHFTY